MTENKLSWISTGTVRSTVPGRGPGRWGERRGSGRKEGRSSGGTPPPPPAGTRSGHAQRTGAAIPQSTSTLLVQIQNVLKL